MQSDALSASLGGRLTDWRGDTSWFSDVRVALSGEVDAG